VLKSTIGFRALTHADAEFAAAVVTAAEPDHPVVAEELLDKWVNTEKVSAVRRFVVQEDGLDRGWISVVQRRDVGGEATYLNLLIPAAHKHLLPASTEFGEVQAREMGTQLLICEVREDRADEAEWLRASGWTLERTARFWRLDLEAKADRIRDLRSAVQGRLKPTGVVIRTVAELGGAAFLPRLHVVEQATGIDIPRSVEHVQEPYENWLVWMQPPDVLLERVWVAMLDGQPVGYSFLAYRRSVVETGYTGVLREHRGKGLARALKLETLFQAIGLGVTSVQTDNDSENVPILHINEELGYQAIPGQLEFHRRLS
jgi:GNAT superfamily N-acetyltransferase